MTKYFLAVSIVSILVVSPIFAMGATYTFQWSRVTQNADGTAITDLAGYNVYAVTSTRTKLNSTTIPASACTTSTCSWSYTPSSGTITSTQKFVCTAIDSQGLESSDSNTASLNATPIPPAGNAAPMPPAGLIINAQ